MRIRAAFRYGCDLNAVLVGEEGRVLLHAYLSASRSLRVPRIVAWWWLFSISTDNHEAETLPTTEGGVSALNGCPALLGVTHSRTVIYPIRIEIVLRDNVVDPCTVSSCVNLVVIAFENGCESLALVGLTGLVF